MTQALRLVGREPVAAAAALRGVVLAGMAFGLKVSAEQLAAVMVALETVLGFVTRTAVAPTPPLPAVPPAE